MPKIIVITSGKGGAGKTTTAINLGAAMNQFGEDVLIIDGNLSTPNIGIHLNSPEVPVNLNHILLKKTNVFDAVYEHESGMKIIPSSLSIKELNRIKPERMKNFRDDFKKISKYVIVDSAAGLGIEAKSAMEMADEIIIVTNPEMPSITDALKTVKIAEQMRKPVIGAIITRVQKNKTEMQPEVVREMLEIPILGMIPEDKNVQKALNMKNILVHSLPRSKSARAYKEIAARLTGAKYNSNDDRPKFWEMILRRA